MRDEFNTNYNEPNEEYDEGYDEEYDYLDEETYKAYERYERAESSLEREKKRQEYLKNLRQERMQRRHQSLAATIDIASGNRKRKEKRNNDRTIAENLGYRAEDRGKKTTLDLFMEKYFSENQRTAIYTVVAIVCVIAIALKIAVF